MPKILSVFGTRPEAIKMCPLILKLQDSDVLESIVCVTGQHKEMLDQVLDVFNITPDYNLNIMRPRQTITSITSDVLNGMQDILATVNPDVVLVHGDTTTSMATALASFYAHIPVGHVEAGLRTYNKYSPFPEEINRVAISHLADFHFAPTEKNKLALQAEGVHSGIYVTGNTVIDSFKTTIKRNYVFHNKILNTIDFSRRVILLTAHRRENIGTPLKNICEAIISICKEHLDVTILYPMHMNPAVREIVEPILSQSSQVILIEPIDVTDMHNLMDKCYLVMTDSGGLQEEAPHLGKPVLVLRTETERPEAVDAGTVKVVGVEKNNIVEETDQLLKHPKVYERMSRAINPYGDGHASERICAILSNEVVCEK